MAEGKARCTACQVEFKAKKDGTPYAHKCVPAKSAEFVAPFSKPATRTCACGEVTTRGAFPGRHEADACGGQSDPFSSPTKAKDYNGEDVHPDESPTHTHTYAWYDDDNGHSGSFCACGAEEPEPIVDHRKWCTRCKLLGHYSADCTTAVLSGGVVSVPVSPNQATVNGMVTVPVVEAAPDRPLIYGGSMGDMDDDAKPEPYCEQCDTDGHLCKGCGEPVPHGAVACLACSTPPAEPDPFSTPTQLVPEVNVSGQPAARYEWYGKQNRGYLVKLPDTGDFRRYKNGKPKGLTRATTFNKAATDQNALADWAKRNVLIGASKRPDVVAKAHGLTHEDNRDQLMKLVAELETTAGAKVSADVGTLIHELTERWDAGVVRPGDIPAQYGDLIYLYDKTLKAAGLWPVPWLIERTTYIPEFGGVVGTLDRVYYHEPSGQYVIGDVKTGKTLKYGMDEIETQEWIYAHGVNNAGVYDWNTDTWQFAHDGCECVNHGSGEDCKGPRYVKVSEDWGVVVHMPVQGDDAGKVMLVRADLQRGKQHAQVCHDVRVQRANKPKPEAWTGEELKAPETAAPVFPPEQLREDAFRCVTSREHAAQLWQEAYDAGVPPEEMARLKEIADARLKGLAKAAEMDVEGTWDAAFDDVQTVKEAGVLWERARAAGVEPMELNRLVSLAQQRLRELGISG